MPRSVVNGRPAYRFDSFDAYDLFTHQWLTECRRVLKDDGAIANAAGGVQRPGSGRQGP